MFCEITETWLCNTIMDSELFDGSNHVFRHDRYKDSTKRGGGVLIAVNSKFRCNEVLLPECYDICEVICIRIALNARCLYVLCLCSTVQ